MFSTVRDHRPLQQGLRQLGLIKLRREIHVRDHRPLQQGLRHASIGALLLGAIKYETIVHYNKD